MKNEERILELLAEALQRIDRHSEQLELQNKSLELQLTVIRTLMLQNQKHQERLDQHADALGAPRERTEVMHQTSLEQQKAYHHDRITAAPQPRPDR